MSEEKSINPYLNHQQVVNGMMLEVNHIQNILADASKSLSSLRSKIYVLQKTCTHTYESGQSAIERTGNYDPGPSKWEKACMICGIKV